MMETYKITSKDRIQLREKITKTLLNEKSYRESVSSFIGEIDNKKRLDIVIGNAGSGKSSVLCEPLSEKYNSLLIDSDKVKELLPEYENGKGASKVHRESKIITQKIFTKALTANKNIVLAIVGKTFDTIKTFVDEASNYGYECNLYLNEVSLNNCIKRSLERQKKTGREVPVDYILEVDDKPYENFTRACKNLDLKSSFIFDNNVNYGEKPVLKKSDVAKEVFKKDFINLKKECPALKHLSTKGKEDLKNIVLKECFFKKRLNFKEIKDIISLNPEYKSLKDEISECKIKEFKLKSPNNEFKLGLGGG